MSDIEDSPSIMRSEIVALKTAVSETDEVPESRTNEILHKVDDKHNQKFLELADQEVNLLIAKLEQRINEDIPEKYEDTQSSGHAGDMSYMYEKNALERSKSLLDSLKQLRE